MRFDHKIFAYVMRAYTTLNYSILHRMSRSFPKLNPAFHLMNFVTEHLYKNLLLFFLFQ